MIFETININDIKAYDRNTKKHTDDDVSKIAASIKKYGMNDPIGVWGKHNVVVEGHGRLEACRKLGITEIPCIRLDNLSDAERREYAIVHNKSAEWASYDFKNLKLEIEQLDFSGFDVDLDVDIDKRGAARHKTMQAVNLGMFDIERTAGKYDMPVIEATNFIPTELIGFNYHNSTDNFKAAIHFFIDDYQFERLWKDPEKVIPRLENFEACLTPDFSLYMDMPVAMKIWNVYRSRLIGQLMQDKGIKVIPTLSWAEPVTYEFCFDGLEAGGTYAVSTVGVMRSKEAREIWKDGMQKALEILKPRNILIYGSKINDFDFGNIHVVHYKGRKFT